jgi:hypothetical protein
LVSLALSDGAASEERTNGGCFGDIVGRAGCADTFLEDKAELTAADFLVATHRLQHAFGR